MGVITHFVMGRMIGIHVLEFTMWARTYPVAYAARVILRGRRDEAAISMMAVMAMMCPMPISMMGAVLV